MADAADPAASAHWWAEVLGWEVTFETRHEVARLRSLGATPADIGQGEVTWTVLADPEGNELCVLSPR